MPGKQPASAQKRKTRLRGGDSQYPPDGENTGRDDLGEGEFMVLGLFVSKVGGQRVAKVGVFNGRLGEGEFEDLNNPEEQSADAQTPQQDGGRPTPAAKKRTPKTPKPSTR